MTHEDRYDEFDDDAPFPDDDTPDPFGEDEGDDERDDALDANPDDLETSEETVEADEDGLEHRRIVIRKALKNRRLDKYLSGRLGKRLSRTALQAYIKEGNVTVNGREVKPSYTLRVEDVIDMMLPPVRKKEIEPEPIPIHVVYEDGDVLAINKQPDLIIHPARGNWHGTLVNGLAYYFQQRWRKDEQGTTISDLPVRDEVFRPGIVHRLDRDTTGILLVAKTELALYRLGYQFEHRKIQKTYTAIVHGLINFDEDVIDSPIGKHPKIREKYAVSHKTGRPFGMAVKDAVTRYKVLERIDNVGPSKLKFTLVEMYPKTGRTHQLRVHMSFIGHPIIGDRMYGGGPIYRSQLEGRHDQAEGPLMTRQALHAHTIEFKHPRRREMLALTAPWPEDFTTTLAELRARAERSV